MIPKFITFAITLVFAGCAVTEFAHDQGEVSPFLYSLGILGNKSVFYHNDTYTFATARTYCQSLGMQLLRIKTAEEQNFLKSKNTVAGFAGTEVTGTYTYWIGARDVQDITQFKWEDGVRLTGVGQTWYSFAAPLTGVVYYASPGSYNGYWRSMAMTTSSRVLCQTG